MPVSVYWKILKTFCKQCANTIPYIFYKSQYCQYKMQQLQFNFQKLNCFLIMINFYENKTDSPTPYHIALVLVVLLYGIRRDKATIKTLFLIGAVISDIVFALTGYKYCYLVAVVFCFINLFYPLRLYWLPRVPDGVAYKRIALAQKYGALDAAIFYPAASDQVKQQIPLCLPGFQQSLEGMYTFGIPYFPRFLAKFVTSYVQRYRLRFSKSEIKPNIKDIMVFSHGLGSDIHSYTTLLTTLALNRIIITVQHKDDCSRNDVPDKVRSVEMLGRVKDVINAYDFIKDQAEMKALLGADWTPPSEIILIGHSYGAATIIETGFTIKQDRPVKCVIALDPWLAPLASQRFSSAFPLKLLSIQSQRFAKNPVLNQYNTSLELSNKNQEVRLTLADSDHVHQSNLGFILGSALKLVHKPERTAEFHNILIIIVRMFIEGVNQGKSMQKLRKDIKERCGLIFQDDFNGQPAREKTE